MAIEVEARFAVSAGEALARLTTMARVGEAILGPPDAFDETDAYIDTVDGALATARWACRLRRRGGRVTVSLKGPPEAGTAGWLHLRPEVEGPATDDPRPEHWPASEAKTLLDRLRGGRPVETQLTLRQHRVERAVMVDGDPIGVLSLDEVTVSRDANDVGRFEIVELELGGTVEPTILAPLAEALARVDGLVPEPRSKLERALQMVGSG